MEPPNNVTHQYITNESKEISRLLNYEITRHINNPINHDLDASGVADYDVGDDVITGSGEEDRASDVVAKTTNFGNHFWQPDNPDTILLVGNDDYDDGLNTPLPQDSSYRRALQFWTQNVISNYLRGNINQSYYWLGRVAHLLEDAAQPSHVHLDPHGGHALSGGKSVLEEYAGNISVYSKFDGKIYENRTYNYENLIPNFNWSSVQPTRIPDNLNKEFFRLFWYTAQKTQYWTSDDVDGNRHYTLLNGTRVYWGCGDGTGGINLWQNETMDCGNMLIYHENLNSNTVAQEANATIPHAMKSVAGLYRLFWDAVHIDWPTENHDFQRTGFTLLKGDLTNETISKQLDFFLDSANGSEQVIKPSIADIDGNGKMDTIIAVHKTTFNTFTKLYGTETKTINYTQGRNVIYKEDTKMKFNPKTVEGGAIYSPPTLADIDGDGNKEIITGTRDGTVYVFYLNGNQLDERWKYHLEPRMSPLDAANEVLFNGGTAVEDIDLDGDKEIILADVGATLFDDEYPGKVYVFDGGTGKLQTSYNVGNGGTYASVSIANVDDDNYPEIIVPTLYGIKVLDYNPGSRTLSEKCSTNHGLLEGSAVVYDVDKDNQNDIIYVTNNWACAAGRTCQNKLYIINGNTCAIKMQKDFTEILRPTPTVANLDNDPQSEIIISSVISMASGLGNISAIDSVSGNVQWTYNNNGKLHPGFISPNVADIDNDGNYNIILGESAGSTVYVLDNNGKLFFNYTVIGFMDNGIAVADMDNDGMAEIAFKRAGSPQTSFVSVSGRNTLPRIKIKDNPVTAIAGEIINLTNSFSASDAENEKLNFYYGSPFNASGQWQTTENDSGKYSVSVEASDGNLSANANIDLIVYNQSVHRISTFSDGATYKLLNFTKPGNLTVTFRIPKNATIIYSRMRIKAV